MGLEDQIDVTDDIGMANAILACSSEMKENPWIRSVAKFHHLPVFVMKVSSFFTILCLCLDNTFAYTCLSCSKIWHLFSSQVPWHKWSKQFA